MVLLALLPTSVAHAAPAKYRSASLGLDGARTVVLSSTKGTVSLLNRSRGPSRLGTSELRYLYAVGSRRHRLATVLLTVRTLCTGSRVVFARLATPQSSIPVTVALKTKSRGYSAHDLHLVASPINDAHVGVDRTSGPYGWIELTTSGVTDRSVFLSKAYRFKTLKMTYRGGGTSTVKQLVWEKPLISVGRLKDGSVRIALGLSAAKDSCERFFVVTPRPIVTLEASAGVIASATVTQARWLDPGGAFLKGPYSIEPRTRTGYVRSLLETRGGVLRVAYGRSGAPLLEDLLLNDVYTLGLLRSADGLWRTNYTSTWVKNESGISAPYVDTRLNECIALESPATADVLDARGNHSVDAIRAWTPAYGSFLTAEAAQGAVIPTLSGFYFADYYDTAPLAKVHASLNHTLGEMNYLLTQCGDSSATPMFDLAMKVKAAVDDSGTAWIAPDGDLFYQRNLDGTFEGADYRTLTLGDLLNSQRLFEKLIGARDPIFDQLIDSKRTFLGLSAPAALTPLMTGQGADDPWLSAPGSRGRNLP